MAQNGLPSDEDILCAKYIKGLLESKSIINIEKEIEVLKTTTGAKFFDMRRQKDFPERDFYLCTEINKFNFILKVVKSENEKNMYIKK